MQTIIGSGGAIGTELAKALLAYTQRIRLVSRNPKKVNDTDEIFSADVLDSNALKKAIHGSSIVYVTVGFTYSHQQWAKKWIPFVKDLINICSENNCKLVFFDNVYMYDPNFLNGMTEETQVNPSSKKGVIRAEIAKMILDAIAAKKLKALIARSADFYGPSISNNSLLTETVFNPLSRGKKANWLVSDRFLHSFTYTIDAAVATALLGNTEAAYGEVWHLPTASAPYTGKQWIEHIAKGLGTKPKIQLAPKFLIKIMGIFNPIMRESVEMLYQYDRDYVFDSSKFEKAFDFTPTPYELGINYIIETDYKQIKTQ
ncbi:NAD-dependent epimerase/dehydratase family protein [Cyclobacterium marinum]|uniref:NAD-dependent epimerase/dehydratase family protein n=1 Tax=Cyclobacterium marinum TaxID=104 RepID=UPI0011EF8818|nr:NAD-dependent epimerase/dehydratase family protein [Cyclobacterium marinum]MBI0398553.1 NAD-dependent epimerase/dehydratase family protein [Cyclobacterium marinum]